MCANPQSNRLNTIAVRASYILPIWSDFLGENQEKPGGGLSPPGKNQNRNRFVFLSFGVDPLNWQSFIEIGEMACSTTAQCSRGHTLHLNPISSDIKTVLTLIKMLTRRIWSTIKSFSSWWSLLYSSDLNLWFRGVICKSNQEINMVW